MVLEIIPRTKVFTEIVHPYPTVVLHSFLKGIQGGLILGFIVGNAVALYKRFVKPNGRKNYSWKKVVKLMGKGVILGVIFTTGITLSKMFKSDIKQNQSRAFRLKINTKQNVIDNVTIGSLFVGQIALKNFQEVELGGGYVGAFVGFILINLLYAIKEKML